MTDQEKDPTPETESEQASQSANNEASAATTSEAAGAADVAIAETEGAAVAPISISRPPIAKILAGIAVVLAVWFLAGIAGGVKQQACLAQVTAKYGSGTTGGKAGVADLARKNNAAKCSSSPF
jgi:hypothetical protein